MNLRLPVLIATSVALLSACSAPDQSSTETPVEPAADYAQLGEVLAAPWRTDAMKARDTYRHPAATLQFCETDPASNVSEIWPGAGWYTAILKPWIVANGGTYNAVLLDPASSEAAADLQTRYLAEFSEPDDNGHFVHSVMSATSGPLAAADSQDSILTFRNVHSWMSRGWSEKAFADFYAALKPGGVLCVVEHRLPSGAVQDPRAANGYVQEAMVKALAKEAGFQFEASSSINANPKDNADHPFGVWTLKPVRKSPVSDADKAKYPDFDRAALDAIGESDRMTLRFRKPGPATTPDPEPATQGNPQ